MENIQLTLGDCSLRRRFRPEKVVNKAEQKAQREEWEEVYCVFDRDNHYYFADAISKAQMLNARFEKKGKEFKAIPSNPCFELWFLLHSRSIREKSIEMWSGIF
jgi:hypothetical protein